MKLKLKNTPEQVELVKALGSKNPAIAREASEAFAAFLGPVIQQVLLQAGTASRIYTDAPFNEDDSPSYPLDLYYNEGVGNISVWSQSMAGGLPTSMVSGGQELKIATYRLDAAVGFLKKYARRSRLDVVSKGLERMAQEVLVKQERNAWAVITKALANAVTNNKKHVTGSTTASVLQVHDFNRLMTLNKRLNESFANGTPDTAYSNGITDLFVSPEMMEQVRAFAYQPMNSRAAFGQSAAAENSNGIALPDNLREGIFNAAGAQEIYGVALNELIELGIGKKYNVLFDSIVTTDGAAGIGVNGVRLRLNSRERDKLYEANINPIASFPAEGIVIFGQKTLQITPSALDRINVRRLMIFLKKQISRFAKTILFDQNVKTTWARFVSKAEPFLASVKSRFGLTEYKIILDETTTTPELVDRNIMYAKILLKPAKAIEFIAIDFVITDSGASFDD